MNENLIDTLTAVQNVIATAPRQKTRKHADALDVLVTAANDLADAWIEAAEPKSPTTLCPETTAALSKIFGGSK